MISLKHLLDMVATEALEFGGMTEEKFRREPCPLFEESHPLPDLKKAYSPPPIRYGLELIRKEDGSLVWTED